MSILNTVERLPTNEQALAVAFAEAFKVSLDAQLTYKSWKPSPPKKKTFKVYSFRLNYQH